MNAKKKKKATFLWLSRHRHMPELHTAKVTTPTARFSFTLFFTKPSEQVWIFLLYHVLENSTSIWAPNATQVSRNAPPCRWLSLWLLFSWWVGGFPWISFSGFCQTRQLKTEFLPTLKMRNTIVREKVGFLYDYAMHSLNLKQNEWWNNQLNWYWHNASYHFDNLYCWFLNSWFLLYKDGWYDC